MKNYDVLINPLTTEKSVRLMETENKLTFIVAKNASKKMIKDAAETLFSLKVKKVNTHNNLGKKIAVVTLHPDFNAMDVATKLGII
ncbi:50S ribosomal protein L23 [archaeon CG_4_10_14_0_2_um_filter_Archaea_38_6]|nr:MAG: 50S ribosomal protein L23 [archaeon CG07_land_8_20_14_0_80_38_8]PIU88955.1 MAG: 50S ribosomal protein L23 [archaeon CG06_land_8_20_14_3_00_37_11]PJA22716.1 MAG: 50S ribosomal protein L23 [archaeon CG_4_10_14_0_2_um_filter_Archaea_38_6]